jgi:hypothetical protein
MKSVTQLMLTAIFIVCSFNYGVAQTPQDDKDQPKSLNEVTINKCGGVGQIKNWIDAERKKALVIDARPFAINQSTGESLFTSGTGRVAVVHMNPFLYDYKISVAQQELISTALSDFLKLLLPPSLNSLPGLQTGVLSVPADKPTSKIDLLEQRLASFNAANCDVHPAACAATDEMLQVFKKIQEAFKKIETKETDPDKVSPLKKLEDSVIDSQFVDYSEFLTALRNEELDTFQTCEKAQALHTELKENRFSDYFSDLDTAQQEIRRVLSLVQELEQLATDYNKDTQLKDKIVRCKGFNCTNQFLEYATTMRAALGGLQRKLDGQRQKAEEMQKMFVFTEQLQTKQGVFARTFTVPKKFELSLATISLKRTRMVQEQEKKTATGTQTGVVNSEVTVVTTPVSAPVVSSEGSAGNSFGPSFVTPGLQAGTPASQPAPANTSTAGTQSTTTATPLVGDVNEVIQLGRPRFMLSGGLVYSPLPRRTFEKVKGFVLDAQGNPTGDSDANVIGFKQNSPRRLLPMLFLNSRVLDYGQGSMYFSFGITAKKDDNVDLEYLVGPAFSFLNDRALFTFGAYGGLTQNLVNDVRVGQEIPDALGDALFYRKRITWKPGFSFSYALSQTKKRDVPASGGKPAAPGDDLKNEIRIGSIPFNLALGMAYTSLEQRTYDEIAGLARDQQGNLTNGQTLARIVGLTSSSSYRLTPLAMLHSRLTNFGSYDFYFTTGLTGKKTKDDFDIEYLLGGTVNVYERKIFLTFGTFIGKQQVLAPGFFEGMALDRGQSVTTQNRYVWKPAISLSYDISRIITRPN